jgi:calmodulin
MAAPPALPGITDQQIRTFRREFAACDTANSGFLDAEAFKAALEHLGIVPTDDEFLAMLQDAGGNAVDLPSFLTVIYYFVRGADKPEELRRALSVFDNDNDGRLSAINVRDILSSLRRPVPAARIDQIIQTLGGTGSIDIGDLIRELKPS